ncbi:MAG: hypothetical protein HRT65_06670 [Flavobacteriaceae bacterium]|nr:hypothetical protein [Flavobacteriaceae bacterium]
MSPTKRLLLLYLLCHASFLSAQEGWMVGIGPTTAPATSLIGANVRAYFGVNERFCFGPEFSFFPYQQLDDTYETSVWEVNLNAHYLFELAPRFGIYPVGGFNFSSDQERIPSTAGTLIRETAPGINYGAGFHYNTGGVLLFTEFKGVIGALSDEFFTIGAVFLLQKPTHPQNQN